MSWFRGAEEWMAPELLGANKDRFDLSTRESDIFALGMVVFEVRSTHRGEPLHGLKHCLMLCSRSSLELELGRL